ncbi:MAG: hypothetical protein V1662_03475 [Candidatus Omnitrophota bacterium]
MENLNTSNIEKICKELLNAFQGILSWEWDSRFETALAIFPVNGQDKILAILKQYLNTSWDISNINKAPKAVQTINKNLSGIQKKQILFTSAPNQECLIFCAWWPWTNAETISLRVAPFCSKMKQDELTPLFKEWFSSVTGKHTEPPLQI